MNIDDVLRSHGILGGRSKDDIPPPPITNFTVDRVGDGFLDLSWSNPDDTDFVGVRIQRKTGGYPISENDGDTAYDGTGTSFTDSGLTNDTTYYYRAFPYDFDSNFQTDTGQQVNGTPVIDDDTTNAPGPKKLIGGDMQAGFFGEVPASELMNGADLCDAIGLTQGNLQHSDEPFLKFAHRGKILFVNKKPIRNSVSWDAIASAGAVYGDGSSRGNAQVTIDGLTYKVRLMKGAREDPANWDLDDRSTIGSEWNDLMYPIHVNANTGDWNYSQYVGNNVPDWGVGYTDEDLLTHNNFGDGSYSWTQETRSDATSPRLNRGNNGVSSLNSYTSSGSNSNRGARFVLELL